MTVNGKTSSDIAAKETIRKRIDFINSLLPVGLRLSDIEKRNLFLYRQIMRDRQFGFIKDSDLSSSVCNPTSEFGPVFGGPANRNILGAIFCEKATNEISRYPSLFYIFPEVSHSQRGSGTSTQPPLEELFDVGVNDYIDTANGSGSSLYEALEPSAIALTIRQPSDWKLPRASVTPDSAPSSSTPFEFSEVAAPEFGGSPDPNDYKYTESGATTNSGRPTLTARNLTRNVIRVKEGLDYKYYRLSMLDKAMMDGRELLSVRVLDLDIDLLTDTSATNGTVGAAPNNKAWIPADSGIVYAFREDAVREDSIVRPNDGDWSLCKDFDELTTNDKCYMSVDPTDSRYPQDPPLNSSTGISPKPVDMYADPDRRPNGFRFINGESLNRPASVEPAAIAGMTFVTDNTVYIKGDFNLHADKTAGGTLEEHLIEEFKGTSSIVSGQSNLLSTTFANFPETEEQNARKLFYGRDKLDDRFANPLQDNWRPVEIFADGITILSDFFTDGWIEDGFSTVAPNTPKEGEPSKISSYLNWNHPWGKFDLGSSAGVEHNRSIWRREASNPASDSSTVAYEVTTPVSVDRNGKVYKRSDNRRSYNTSSNTPAGSSRLF